MHGSTNVKNVKKVTVLYLVPLLLSLVAMAINITTAFLYHSALDDYQDQQTGVTSYNRNVGLIIFIIISSCIGVIIHCILLGAKLGRETLALFDLIVLVLTFMMNFAIATVLAIGITNYDRDYDQKIATRNQLKSIGSASYRITRIDAIEDAVQLMKAACAITFIFSVGGGFLLLLWELNRWQTSEIVTEVGEQVESQPYESQNYISPVEIRPRKKRQVIQLDLGI